MNRRVNFVYFILLLVLMVTLAPATTFAQAEVVCESDVVVQADDWLSKIADKFYGNALAFPVLVEATNAKAAVDNSYTAITNVDVIEPGWKLCLVNPAEAQAMLAKTSAAAPQAAGEVTTLRFVWFTDGPDQPAIEKLVAQFNQANPDIKIEFSIVPFADLNQLLQTQAAAGEAPDLARVTEPPRFHQYALDLRPYLSNPDLPGEFLAQPMTMVTGPNGEVYGIPHDFTLNGPFVNLSLFEQAGVALPTEECVGWETWADLGSQVQQASGAPFAMAVDRSGHRLDGFIQSYGGGYFNPDGTVRLASPETRQGIEAFVRLHEAGTFPLDVWVGGGQSYAAANQFFINNQLPVYLSGNWQVAQFHQAIGDKFKWTAVLNGCESQYGGMPGGKFIVAFNNTKTPEKVARLIEYLGSKAALRQYAQDALFLPTRKDLIAEGIEYPIENEVMKVFLKGITLLPETAYVDNYNKFFGPVANEVRDRVTQVIAGELSLDEAIPTAEEKAKELISQ
ncbi:MAG: extracellular solute-binding protein [Chloroflexota bacterium]